jgi:polyphosphate glucokinase
MARETKPREPKPKEAQSIITKTPLRALGIDVGGSGVKAAPVQLKRGVLQARRKRVPTPQPATPKAVADAVEQLVNAFKWNGAVGCTVPARVRHGVVETASNISHDWIGTDASELLSDRLGRHVAVLNDADAAGLAEMRFGAGRGCDGVCLVLTFGTGIGSALFARGRLVPNTELGHLHLEGRIAEHVAASAARERDDLTWADWATNRVQPYLSRVEFLLAPDLIIIGGGVSRPERWAQFGPILRTHAKLAPAALGNEAGIVGAALAARVVAARRPPRKR